MQMLNDGSTFLHDMNQPPMITDGGETGAEGAIQVMNNQEY